MDFQPYVSVVVPSLNRAHLLRPTIESILGQDYPNIECIVMDAGSTDGTLDILKSYGDRITWVSEPDEGQSDAINKGWQMGRGEVLAWLNADDLWAVPSAVSQAVEFLENHPDVDVVYGDCGVVDAEGNQVGMSYLHEWDLEYAVEFHDVCIPQPASFVRRRILEEVGFLDTKVITMDKELWFRIGLRGKIQHLPVLLAHQRNTPGITWDGLSQAEDCVRIVRKFYSLPDISAALMAKKKRAISNTYLQGAAMAYGRGRHWGLVLRYVGRAMIEDPTNVYRVIFRVLRAGLFFLLGRTHFLDIRNISV